jgi:protein gp37
MDISNGKWWDRAWSLVEGCTPISAACELCWLAAMDYRFEKGHASAIDGRAYFQGNVEIREDRLNLPLRTRKPTVWAVWSDLFHEKVPDDFIQSAYQVMNSRGAIDQTFLVLTKRPERMADFLKGVELAENIYSGTTVENQETADKRIPELLRVPGKRFISYEPALGAVDFTEYLTKPINPALKMLSRFYNTPDGKFDKEGKGQEFTREVIAPPPIHAVIAGGESGPGARPSHPDWFRSVRDQCSAAGVPFFFKQWGEWGQPPPSMKLGDICMSPDGHFDTVEKGYVCLDNESEGEWLRRVGKKKAGRILDGRTHDELPWVSDAP